MFSKSSKRKLFFTFALVCGSGFAPVSTVAQTCRVYCPDGRSFVVQCNTSVDPCPSSGGPVQPGPDLFQLSVARYDAVLARLLAYQIKFNDQTSPRTPEELSRQAGTLFQLVAYRLDTWNSDSARFERQTSEYESLLQGLYTRERDLRSRANALPAELREASENLSRALARAEAQERVVASVEAVTDQMHVRADRAASETMQWLAVAAPRKALMISPAMVASRARANREPMGVPVEPVVVRAERPFTPAQAIAIPGFRDAPGGSADEKIAATEALIPQIASAKALYDERSIPLIRVRRLYENTTARVEALAAPVGRGEGSLSSVEALTRNAESRQSQAIINGYRAGANAAGAIAEAYILETFRDKVVIPEVKRFLRANGITKKIDSNAVVQLYQAGKSVLPDVRGKRWVQINRLIDAEKRAVAVIEELQNLRARRGRVFKLTD